MDNKTGVKSMGWRFIGVMALAVSGGMFVSRAGAMVINPGDSFPTTGAGTFSGTVIDNETSTFNSGSYIGSLHSQVYRESDNYLDFVYQFTNDNIPNADSITTLSLSSFNYLWANADDKPVAGDVAPDTVSRTPVSSGDDTISFLFTTTGVAPGQTTDQLVVQTHATSFYEGNASFLDTFGVSVQAPVPVPEPVSLSLLATGAVALLIRRRRA